MRRPNEISINKWENWNLVAVGTFGKFKTSLDWVDPGWVLKVEFKTTFSRSKLVNTEKAMDPSHPVFFFFFIQVEVVENYNYRQRSWPGRWSDSIVYIIDIYKQFSWMLKRLAFPQKYHGIFSHLVSIVSYFYLLSFIYFYLSLSQKTKTKKIGRASCRERV